ncbi:MAG TPA: homocysteine S-methyltransferase family protein [Candidatus Eisenbacteria bacterium]|nr:homocysteine S-methyltransferase family protein [Candidatus Eisenbacteria bacterium]
MTLSQVEARLRRGEIILLDGAMGTELERLGVPTALPLWSAQAVLDAPERVREVHEAYAEAGADVLTAATFRTTPRSVAKAGLKGDPAAEAEELTARAVTLAREARTRAASGRDVAIAGALAPLEDCYRHELVPDDAALEREHHDQAARLARAGADLILIETMGTIREAVAASRAALATGLPVLTSFMARSASEIGGGESLAAGVAAVVALDVDAVLVNCVPATIATGCLEVMSRITRSPIGCYPNAGSPDLGRGTWCFDPEMTPERFAEHAAAWVGLGAQIVGGCCGTGPAHIRALRAALPPVLVE